MTLIALMMLAADPLAEPLPEVVLLDFTASYCGPCREMVPSIQRMEKDGFPIRKVDITQHPDVSRRFQVEMIPTFIVLVNGEEKKRFVGKRSEDELRRVMLAERDALRAAQEPAAEEEVTEVAEAEEEQRPRGLSGILTMLRDGFGGRRRDTGFQHPLFRAQSPDTAAASGASDAAMAATVRVRVKKPDGKLDVGTGSVIHSTAELSTILTCAHLFRGAGRQPNVEVELVRDGRILKYPAAVIAGDHELELAILQIQTTSALPTVQVAPMAVQVQSGEPAFSIGCDHGSPPSQLAVKVVDIDRYEGPSNLVCTVDPAVGRSGGGLFNTAGQLIGVCSCADRDQHEGLYMGRKPIHDLFTRVKLGHLLKPQSPAEQPPAFSERPSDLSVGNEIAALIEGTSGSMAAQADPGFVPPAKDPAVPEFVASAAGDGVMATAAADVATASSSAPAEITVIVGSDNGSTPKEMIVIRNPSPFLMELLTGQTSPSPQLASARRVSLRPSGPHADRE